MVRATIIATASTTAITMGAHQRPGLRSSAGSTLTLSRASSTTWWLDTSFVTPLDVRTVQLLQVVGENLQCRHVSNTRSDIRKRDRDVLMVFHHHKVLGYGVL